MKENMKDESRKYYDYWHDLNIRVEISLNPVKVYFHETQQEVDSSRAVFPTLEEAKAYALSELDNLHQKIIQEINSAKRDLPITDEDSAEYLEYNPEGGW